MLARLLAWMNPNDEATRSPASGARADDIPADDEDAAASETGDDVTEDAADDDVSAWSRVELARHPDRPYTLDYTAELFDGFVELHGDRRYGDDMAIVAGLAWFEGRPVAVIGHQKGRHARERARRNFAMARPEGYRKAMRIMRLASKLGRPIITLIDTPGAYCLDEAEARVVESAAWISGTREALHRRWEALL